jgi:alkanesulfonate monooxygenase SsuD/methylene tetrahydromethanopterin reductase-like flavin-dependent oxidoreductase (luciferase family)
VAAVPDTLVDEFVVHGSPQRCRERLAEYADDGVTHLALSLLPLDRDPIETVKLLAPR